MVDGPALSNFDASALALTVLHVIIAYGGTERVARGAAFSTPEHRYSI